MSKPIGLVPNYTDAYIESVFFLWYENGRDTHIGNKVVPSADGNIPQPTTIAGWKRKYGWEERADVLDAQVSMKLEKEAVQKKAKAITKMAEAGESMLDEGLKFIKENKFDSSSAAVRAVMGGAEMLSQYVGMGEFILGMSKMNNAQLTKEMYRLLGKSEDDVVDAETIEESEDATDKSEDDNGI
jgi:hypothetical protein